ncbi:MAG: exodeoxyribonuclease VII small subunit [Phycisphaerae bacterium]|nr:exodeoxyribonuclease VII small subunit [Phycisphaerae bacterium]
MAQNKKDDISKLQFEEAIESLTGIVNNIESGETDLQASLEQYERGMKLINHCRDILQAAEKRIEKISAKRKDADDDDSDEPEDEDTSEDNADEGLF